MVTYVKCVVNSDRLWRSRPLRLNRDYIVGTLVLSFVAMVFMLRGLSEGTL